MDTAVVRLQVQGPEEEGRLRPADRPRELHDAAREGDLRRLRQLLAAKDAPPVDAEGDMGYRWDWEKRDWVRCRWTVTVERMTALSLACFGGHLDIVRYLVEEKGADIHARGERALSSACEGGHLDIVRYLVEEERAEVHAHSERALHNACEGGHLDIVRYLVEEKRADVHAHSEWALGNACKGGHLDIVRYLVQEKRANVHAHSERALRNACEGGHLDIVRYLVEEKVVDVQAVNRQALYDTYRGGHIDIARYLAEEKQADVSALDSTYFNQACAQGREDWVRFLGYHGVDIHAGREQALALACAGGHVGVVRYLVEEKQADAHAANQQALRNACRGGHFDIARYLVEEKLADVSALHSTFFSQACEQGRDDWVRLLGDHGVDIHAGREQALALACAGGHLDIVRYLVEERHASPRTLHDAQNALRRSITNDALAFYFVQHDPALLAIVDNDGRFPLDLASQKLKDRIAQFLPRKVLKGCLSTMPPPTIELHLIGFGGVGKTRLKCALTGQPYQEAPVDSPVDPQTQRKLAECTVGVTVSDLFCSRASVWDVFQWGDRRVKVFDYGGQREFRGNIATVLPRPSTSIIIVAVSLKGSMRTCRASLVYFLALVASCRGLVSAQAACTIAVVATHADLHGPAEVQQRKCALESILHPWRDRHEQSSVRVHGTVFCVDGTQQNHDQVAELRELVRRDVQSLRREESRQMPVYCSKMIKAIEALREDRSVAPCLPKQAAIDLVLQSDVLRDDGMSAAMAGAFLDYLERCGEIMTLHVSATTADDTVATRSDGAPEQPGKVDEEDGAAPDPPSRTTDWLVLDLHTLLHRIVGRLQAPTSILQATERAPEAAAFEELRHELRERQVNNELIMNPGTVAQLTGCDEIFPFCVTTEQRAQLMVHVLEAASLCVRLPRADACGSTTDDLLYFPAFADRLLGDADEATVPALQLQPQWTRVGRRFTPPRAASIGATSGSGAATPDLIFPSGSVATIQASMVRYLRDRWNGVGKMFVTMYCDCLIVDCFKDGAVLNKAVLRVQTLDTFGTDDHASARELASPSFRGEFLYLYVACLEHGGAAYTLLQDIRDRVVIPHIPWMPRAAGRDATLDRTMEQIVRVDTVGQSLDQMVFDNDRPDDGNRFGARFDDTGQLLNDILRQGMDQVEAEAADLLHEWDDPIAAGACDDDDADADEPHGEAKVGCA